MEIVGELSLANQSASLFSLGDDVNKFGMLRSRIVAHSESLLLLQIKINFMDDVKFVKV